MSEAKKIIIGVLGGVLGIAVLFTLVLMLVGKGDEPVSLPQPILAQQPKPVPPKPAPVQVQPQPLLAEQPPTEPRTVNSAERIGQVRSEASPSKPDAQVPDENVPPLVQGEAQRGSAAPAEQASASSTRTEPTSEEHPSSSSDSSAENRNRGGPRLPLTHLNATTQVLAVSLRGCPTRGF